VGSWRTAPADELRAWLKDLAVELPPGTRLRIRLYRHGGKPIRGVVCRTPVPCPSCAELASAVRDQNHRLDDASDERDDALARIDELEAALEAARDRRDHAVEKTKRLKHQFRTALRQAAEWKCRAEHGEALVEMINALELP
jgi:predicted nuclease with TOPRIM domain